MRVYVWACVSVCIIFVGGGGVHGGYGGAGGGGGVDMCNNCTDTDSARSVLREVV